MLTADELQTIADWVRAGAPIGSGDVAQAPGDEAQAPGRVLELAPPAPYLPRATGGAMDDYHCFLLEPNLSRDAFVTRALVKPGNPDIVHHVILFEAAGAQADEARRLDAASGHRGWSCFGGPGIGEQTAGGSTASSDRLGAPQWIRGWAPGAADANLPSGTGVLLHAGSAVVMQVHYNLMHKPRPDRSSAVLQLVDAAGSDLVPLDTILVAAPVELPCPPPARGKRCARSTAVDDEVRKYGDAAAQIPLGLLFLCGKTLSGYPQHPRNVTHLTTSCDRRVRRPLRIYGVAGHMHLRGVDVSVVLNPGSSNERVLLHIPHWDFHWQGAYYLQQPVDANPGDTVRVSCTFDNSAAHQPETTSGRMAPRYVLWGEGTTDEMCLGILQAATRGG